MTVAWLVERQVSLDWQEAVAIALEVAEAFERSGQRWLPKDQNLAITPTGTVRFQRGRRHSGNPVSALAQTLDALLPRDRPTQLRLIVSTAGPKGSAYTSVAEFSEALKYFERPGRRNILSDVYDRARQTPPPSTETTQEIRQENEPSRPPKNPRRLRRMLVPTAAVLLLAALVAASAVYLERWQPGAVSGQANSFRTLASAVWDTAQGFGGEFGESASEDLRSVVGRLRELGSRVAGGAAAAEPDADDTTAGANATPSANPDSGRGGSVAVPVGDASESHVGREGVSGDDTFEPSSLEPAAAIAPNEALPADPLASAVFDSGDPNVTPPVALRVVYVKLCNFRFMAEAVIR